MKKIMILLALVPALSLARGGRSAAEEEQFRAALEECITETGVTKPEDGQRPSDEDRAKVDSCLESKGFKKPAGPPRHQRQGDTEASANLGAQ